MLNEEMCRNAFQSISDGTVEIKNGSIYNPFEDELCIFEQLINEYFESHKIVYLCDHRDCKKCSSNNLKCEHTTNIKHAKNFENVGGIMWEVDNKPDQF